MPDNPYAAAINRYFGIALGCLGAVAMFWLVIASLLDGSAPGISWRNISTYTRVENPSQFWFCIVFYAAIGAVMTGLAWRSWRRQP